MNSLFITFCLLFAIAPLQAANPARHVHAHAADAPSAARITLDEVIRAALAKNPAIKAASLRWNAAKARVPQAAAWEDLKVSAQSRLLRFVNVPRQSFSDQTLTVEQMLPVAGKNLSRARIAAAEALSALEELRRQRLNTVSKAREAYYRLENAFGQLALNQKSMESLQQIAEISRSQYEVGKQSAADVLVAESEASKLHESEHDLLRAISEAQTQLNVLMDRDAFAALGEPVASAFSPQEFTPDRMRALTLAFRPEIRMAKAKAAAEKARLELARRDALPDVGVQLTAQRYNSSQAVSEVDAGISVTVPWFNRAKYSAEAQEAVANLAAAEQDLQQAKTEAAGMLRDQLQRIETARHHVELFNESLLPKAQQAFEATQLGYETGKTGFTEWIAAQRTLRDLQAMSRQDLSDYQIAVAQLESVTGSELRASPSPLSKSEPRQP